MSSIPKPKWGCCLDNEEDGDFIQCVGCKMAYHPKCLGIAGPKAESKKWKCPKCTGKKVHREETCVHTPPKGTASTSNENASKRSSKRPAISSPTEERPAPVTRDDVREIVKDVFKSEMSTLILQINDNFSALISRELKGLKSEISDMKESMNFISLQYEEIKDQHQSAIKSMEELRVENTDMRTTIKSLSTRVGQLEQQARASNIEIQNVPERKTENLLNIVSSLCTVVSCTLTPDDIVKCTRIAKIDPKGARPRSIVVQLSSPNLRDRLLAAVKTYNRGKKKPEDKLNTADIHLSFEKTPIFIMEHLTPGNKALHAAARLRAKEKNYKYVWTRNGRIFVRKEDETDFILIKDSTSLDKIV